MEAGRARHVDDGVELGKVGIPVQVDDRGEGLEGGRLHPGLDEKPVFFKKKTSPEGFWGFFGCLGFFVFFLYIYPEASSFSRILLCPSRL